MLPATVSKISSEKEGSVMIRLVAKTCRWMKRRTKAKLSADCDSRGLWIMVAVARPIVEAGPAWWRILLISDVREVCQVQN
jgi:hypothetical protein